MGDKPAYDAATNKPVFDPVTGKPALTCGGGNLGCVSGCMCCSLCGFYGYTNLLLTLSGLQFPTDCTRQYPINSTGCSTDPDFGYYYKWTTAPDNVNGTHLMTRGDFNAYVTCTWNNGTWGYLPSDSLFGSSGEPCGGVLAWWPEDRGGCTGEPAGTFTVSAIKCGLQFVCVNGIFYTSTTNNPLAYLIGTCTIGGVPTAATITLFKTKGGWQNEIGCPPATVDNEYQGFWWGGICNDDDQQIWNQNTGSLPKLVVVQSGSATVEGHL